MPEGEKRVPKILRCICMETKIDMLVVGEKNASILQKSSKNDGEALCDTF